MTLNMKVCLSAHQDQTGEVAFEVLREWRFYGGSNLVVALPVEEVARQ